MVTVWYIFEGYGKSQNLKTWTRSVESGESTLWHMTTKHVSMCYIEQMSPILNVADACGDRLTRERQQDNQSNLKRPILKTL